MSDYKKILCPIDFSEYSEHALDYASAFAKQHGGTIDCVHVVDMGFMNAGAVDGVYVSSADLSRSLEAIEADSKKKLEHFVRKEHLLGTEITPHLKSGHAPDEIVKLAEELGSDMIVIATHGRSGLEHMVFGSTCDKVLRTSPIPVLSVKHPEHEALKDGALDINRVLCPVDFSEFSQSALPIATALCKEFGATLVLAHVVDARFDYPEWTAQAAWNSSTHLAESSKENLDSVASEIAGVETEVFVGTGVPHRVLSEKITEDKIDLVVMPTHGRKGLSHALLGSVAEKIVRSAPCPVLTARPSA